MADASRFSSFSNTPPPAGPHDWREAFIALPQDAPDASRWPALAQALAARTAARARRRRIGLALAAGLCALALLPFSLRRAPDDAPPEASDSPQPTATQVETAAPIPTSPAPSTTVRHDDPAPAIADAAVIDDTAVRSAPPRVRTARHAGPREGRRALAARRQTPRTVADTPTDASANADAGAVDTLDTLYAASAQLETLLTLTRDPRVDSGPAAALAGGYDAEIAAVDAQLAQPELSLDEQRRLWRARVDLLQQATGLESQLRVLAASGRRLDGALVRVD